MERILPAEIFVIHLHAGYTALLWIFLFIKLFLQSFFSVNLLLSAMYLVCCFILRRKFIEKVALMLYFSVFFCKIFYTKFQISSFLNKISIVFHVIHRYYSWLYYIKVPLCALLLFSYGILKGWSKKQHRQKAFPYILYTRTRAHWSFSKNKRRTVD